MFIAVPVHSFIDVITNSSTELFVCNTEKSLQAVEEILRELIDYYNAGIFPDDGFAHIPTTYEACFAPPRIYTRREHEEENAQINAHVKFMKEKFNNYNAWDGYGYEKEENIGKIIIESNGVNAIPYSLWGVINQIFDANNYHIG